jgi:hypothetical protein
MLFVINALLARPKRFELLTPRFVGGPYGLMALPFLANRPVITLLNLKGLRGSCKPKGVAFFRVGGTFSAGGLGRHRSAYAF